MTDYLIATTTSNPVGICVPNGLIPYVLLVDSSNNSYQFYKANNVIGSGWSTAGSSVTSSGIWGTSNAIYTTEARINQSNIIHVMSCRNIASGVCIKWNTFDTSNNTWGANWESVFTSDIDYNGVQGILAIDKDGYPWIASDDTTKFICKNRTSGSWSASETIAYHEAYTVTNKAFQVIDSNTAVLVTYTSNGGYRRTYKHSGTWDGGFYGFNYPNNYGKFRSNSIVFDDGSGWVSYGYEIYMANYPTVEDGTYLSWYSDDLGLGGCWAGLQICIFITQPGGDNASYLKYRKKKMYGSWGSPTDFSTHYPNTNTFFDYNPNFHNELSSIGVVFQVQGQTAVYYTKLNFSTVATPTSIHAYLYGGVAVSSSKSAYLKAGVTAITSHPAYTLIGGQLLYPDADISVNSWQNEVGGSTLYPSIADDLDSTYDWYNQANSGEWFEVSLSNPVNVPDSSGRHCLAWRVYKKEGVLNPIVKYELKQGSGILITSDTEILTDTINTFYKTLTSAEVANITNYNDLRLRITVIGKS